MRRLSKDRWLDLALAAAALIALEAEILTSKHRSGPIVLNVLIVAAITIPAVWRRRWPLEYATLVMALVVLSAALTNIDRPIASLFVLFIPAYTVGAYEDRTRATVGLAVCLVGPWVASAIAHSTAPTYLFTAGFASGAWAAGRALHAQRLLNQELARKAQRLAAERDSRERLAVADERTKIARELHTVVAGSVSAMVVQTEVAEQLLGEDPVRADAAMAAVEAAGRQTLTEMRRILGVLRRTQDAAELAPQPGVGQIHRLIERARQDHREISFELKGDPVPLPASIDLGLYRILEEALTTLGPGSIEVKVRFTAHDVELDVTAADAPSARWPTLAMQERVTLCDGELEADGPRLWVRLPRVLEEVFA